MSTTSNARSRRLLVAVGMVGGPLCLATGDLIAPQSDGSPEVQLAVVHAHLVASLVGYTVTGAGFALLGALGVGIAMLLPGRGGRFATVGAVLTLLGGITMGGATVTTGFVDAAIPPTAASALGALESSQVIGQLFTASYLAAIGALVLVVALLVGRPVRVWVPILLLVGVVLSMAAGGGGPFVGALLTVPLIVAVAALAGRLLRTEPVRAAVPAREPIRA